MTERAHIPITMFEHLARALWSQDVQRHVSECEHCQRLLAVSYRVDCPDTVAIAKAVENSQGGNDKALWLHIQRDHCINCELRRKAIEDFLKLPAKAPPRQKEVPDEYWRRVQFLQVTIPPSALPRAVQMQKGPGIVNAQVHEPTSIAVKTDLANIRVDRSPNQLSVSIKNVSVEFPEGELVASGLKKSKHLRFDEGTDFVKLHADDLEQLEGDSALVVLFPKLHGED